VDSGSYTQSTYKSNEEDFQKIKLRQRVGINISKYKFKNVFLNKMYSRPFGFSPCGMGGMLYPDGEILVAQICEKFDIPYLLSTMSICSIEQVADNTKAPFWFQLYVMKDKDFVKDIISRARRANCYALVLTMDLQILAQRHQDIRNGLTAPPRPTLKHLIQLLKRPSWCLRMLKTKNRTFGNILGHAKGVSDLSSIISWTNGQFDQELSWDYVEWIKKLWKGPLVIKGILDEQDAEIAKNIGVDGIIVSNHGGRQLDGTSSSIMALNKVVDKVGKDIEVFFDGGVRSGQDIVKAISLGAKGVFMGRPYMYGLGADGKRGVEKVIEILTKELKVTMGLCGKTNVNDLNYGNLY